MKFLVVVDMQNDFCKPGGVLYNPDAEAIIPNIIERCKEYEDKSIIFTSDAHDPFQYPYTVEGTTLPMHCEQYTKGYKIVDELQPFVDTRNVKLKTSFACDWSEYNLGPMDTIELCGTCTDICVISNALALRSKFPGVEIIVHANCCAGLTPEKHEAALKVMESCLIKVVR